MVKPRYLGGHCYWAFPLFILGGLFAGMLILGCGGKVAERIPVEGLVTLDGKPIGDAAVLFLPLLGGAPTSCVTDDSGRFKLETTTLPGIEERDFRVAISKTHKANSTSEETEDSARSFPEGFVSEKQIAVVNMLPSKYVNAQTSELRAKVTTGVRSSFTFSLTSDETVEDLEKTEPTEEAQVAAQEPSTEKQESQGSSSPSP